jgi:hypothetical protein
MGIDIRLPVGSGLSLLGLILAACGILAATSYGARYLGLSIFNFRPAIFLFASGLTQFLPGDSGIRVEPQPSQSLESTGY